MMANQTLSTQVITKNFSYLNDLFQGLATKAVVALIILLLGFIIGRLVGKGVRKVLHELLVDDVVKKTTGIKLSVEAIIGHTISFIIYMLFIVAALAQMGLATTVINIIAACLIALVVVSLFLAVKDYIPNFLAGLYILRRDLLKPGDYIKTKDLEGKVVYSGIIETRIETKKGDIIYMPNSILVKNELIRVSRMSKQSSPKD